MGGLIIACIALSALCLFLLVQKVLLNHRIRKLAEQVDAPLALEVCPLDRFWDAEEYHQKYLDKTPGGYCHVPWEEIDWVKTVDLQEI